MFRVQDAIGNIMVQITLVLIGSWVVWLLIVDPPLLKPWWGIRRPPNHKNSRWFT